MDGVTLLLHTTASHSYVPPLPHTSLVTASLQRFPHTHYSHNCIPISQPNTSYQCATQLRCYICFHLIYQSATAYQSVTLLPHAIASLQMLLSTPVTTTNTTIHVLLRHTYLSHQSVRLYLLTISFTMSSHQLISPLLHHSTSRI